MAKLEDKTLTPAEQVRLREFVQEVWTTAYYDYEGVTGSLGEEAEVAAEILGFKLVKQTPSGEDLDDDDTFPE
jgi:hypothetical protein